MMEKEIISNAERCYECTANGDDYYLDGNNEWVKACDDCPYNDLLNEED